jgi:YaiO family outer membrane protein
MRILINNTYKKNLSILVFTLLSLCTSSTFAQEGLSSDSLFRLAREAAFNKKDYPSAVQFCHRALKKSPDYNDIRVFLGRVYTWTDRTDSARTEFLSVLKKEPGFEDASAAITDLEYWNNNSSAALGYCNQGLQYHPDSKDLLLKKIKILKYNKKFIEAYQIATAILQKDPSNTTVRSLILDINDAASLNKVGVGYDLTWFDGGYGDYLHKSPWHIINVEYARYTPLGSITGRVNRGTRFGNSAFQAEIDAYPRICKGLYAYTNVGISDVTSVFPHYRAGMSLYATLPKSFEAELGFRYLRFSSSTWIYVGSISKYYRSFWFSGRLTLVPGENNISHSYTFISRYYFGGADDYLNVSLNYGISPDDTNAALAYNNGTYKLISKGISLGYKRSIKKMNIISVSSSLYNQEYRLGQKGNQIGASVSYQRRF